MGGPVLIFWNVEGSVKEAERQVNKRNSKTVNHDCTTANNETVNVVLLRFQKENLLSNKPQKTPETKNT